MQSFRMIAPACHNNLMINIPDGDGVWHEGNDSMAVFRWQVSSQANQDLSEMHFGVAIYPSGIIELFTGELNEGGLGLVSGISQGNKKNFVVLFEPGLAPLIPGAATRLSPEWFPEGMNISREGNLTGTPLPGDTIYSVNFRVTDERRVSSTRNLVFTPGPWINLRPMLDEGSQLSFGDTVAFVLQVKNFTGQTLEDLTMTMAEDDPFAFFPDDLAEIGSLAPGDSLTIPGAFQMEVSPTVPDMHPMICWASLETGEQGPAWQQQFIFSPAAPRIFVEHFTIDDGNNGLLEPGETAQLGIVLANLGHAGIENVTGMLEPLEDGIYVTSDPAWAFGLIPKMNTVEATFTIFADPDLPAGFKGHLVMGWSSDSGLQGSDTLEIRVGKVPVLVVDLDPNQLSGPAIAGALDQLGVACEYEQEFPGFLDNYYSIFLCLGQRFSNHVLTWNEGNHLKSFLDEGGLMYMEGWDTWGYDPMTPLHPMFHTGTVPVLTTFNDIEGEPGTFTEGMLFSNNSSYTFDFYHLVPAGPPALSILKSHENQVSCAVAYDAGSYKTVGANIELGQLGDGLFPSTKVNLMSGILEFFGIQTYPVHIQEKEPASGLQATAYPNPTLGLLTLRITNGNNPGAGIQLFDITGREVALTPGRSVRTEGIQLITLQIPPSCPGGIYIYKISGNEGTVTGKVHLLR
jgi:hypothetical protein